MANSTIKTQTIEPQLLSVVNGPNVSTTSNALSPEVLRVAANMVRRATEATRS
jgi:hypothetical protein